MAFSVLLVLNEVEMASALNLEHAPKDIFNKVQGLVQLLFPFC